MDGVLSGIIYPLALAIIIAIGSYLVKIIHNRIKNRDVCDSGKPATSKIYKTAPKFRRIESRSIRHLPNGLPVLKTDEHPRKFLCPECLKDFRKSYLFSPYDLAGSKAFGVRTTTLECACCEFVFTSALPTEQLEAEAHQLCAK